MNPALLPCLLAGSACALYLLGTRRVRVARLRTACFATGVAGAGALVAWDPGSLTAHMVQHGLLTAVAAPLVVLGEPLTLVLRCASPRGRRTIYRLLHALRHALRPSVGLATFVVVQWLAHLPAALDAAEARPALHASLHALLLTSAVVFFLPLLGRQPLPRRLPGGQAALRLLAAISLIDLVSVPYVATGRANAAAAMLAAMAPLGAIAALLAWRSLLREERRMVQREARA